MFFQLSIFEIVSGAEENTDTYYKGSEAFLKSLKIIDDDEIDPTRTLTRGEAASYIAAMLRKVYSSRSYRGIFSDVDESNENALAIETIAEFGIVKGDGNRAFRPNDYLTYEEANIMFMNVLGYGSIGMSNSIAAVSKTKITDGIIAEFDVVALGDFLIMTENTLMANPVTQTSWTEPIMYEISQQTLLYKVFDIVYAEGIVVKNDLTYLWTTTNGENSSIILENKDGTVEIYADDMDNLRDSLGKSIRVYYYNDKDTNKCMYVHHEEESFSNVLKINFSQIEPSKTSFVSGKIAYYAKEKSNYKIVSLEDGFNVIYNNAAYKTQTLNLSILENKVGNIELIDAESDGLYETVKIKVFDSLVVGNISLSNNFISDKYKVGMTVDIDLDNYEKVFVYTVDGKKADFSSVVPGCVLSVAKSDTYNGNNILEIHISEDIRNGKITDYTPEKIPQSIEIDGMYSLDLFDRAASGENGKLSYTINTNAIVYVDAFGNAVYISDDRTLDLQYGIITGVHKSENTLNNEAKIRLITASGTIEVLSLDEKTIIDGTPCDTKKAYDVLSKMTISDIEFSSGTTVCTGIIPAKYKLNDNGDVKIIDTVTSGTGKNDSLKYVGGGSFVSVSGNVLGYTIPYNSDAILLEITSQNLSDISAFDEEKNIKALSPASVLTKHKVHDVIAYKSDDTSKRADFIIKLNTNPINADSDFMVVDRVKECYDKDVDDVVYKLSGFVGGIYSERVIKDETNVAKLKTYKMGDILFVSSDRNNAITGFSEILVRSESGIKYQRGENVHVSLNKSSEQALTSLCGYVKSIDGSLVEIRNYGFSTIDSVEKTKWNENLVYAGLDGATFTVIDDTVEKIYSGSVSDIIDYDNFGVDCSLIFVKLRSSNVKDVFIYK